MGIDVERLKQDLRDVTGNNGLYLRDGSYIEYLNYITGQYAVPANCINKEMFLQEAINSLSKNIDINIEMLKVLKKHAADCD